MLQFLTDENFNAEIVDGVCRRLSGWDVISVQEAQLRGMPDPEVLEWAAAHRRVLLTHDVNTMPRYAYERVRAGLPMPGVFEVLTDAPIGPVIEDIILIAEGSLEGEWEGQVRYLPLR